MLNHLIVSIPQAQDVPAKNLLISQCTANSTLAAYFKAFLVACRVEGLSPHTIRSYHCLINPFIKYLETYGVVEPAQITAFHIRAFILLKQETCNATSIHTYYRQIKTFINWLVKEEVLPKSPMRTIKPPRTPRTLIQPFSPDDLRSLLSFCQDNTLLGLRNKAIILLFVDTGLRLAELTHIALSDINFERGVIKVMGKGARERIVHMGCNTQRAVLKYLMKRTDNLPCLWVTERQTPLRQWAVVQAIRILGRKANLKNVRCSAHTFRHTAATLALENGALEFEVQAMLGHSTLDMTRRYASSINSEKAAFAHKRFSPVQNLNLG